MGRIGKEMRGWYRFDKHTRTFALDESDSLLLTACNPVVQRWYRCYVINYFTNYFTTVRRAATTVAVL